MAEGIIGVIDGEGVDVVDVDEGITGVIVDGGVEDGNALEVGMDEDGVLRGRLQAVKTRIDSSANSEKAFLIFIA